MPVNGWWGGDQLERYLGQILDFSVENCNTPRPFCWNGTFQDYIKVRRACFLHFLWIVYHLKKSQSFYYNVFYDPTPKLFRNFQ